MEIKKSFFGKTRNGIKTQLFTLKNKNMAVSLTNYGGIVTSALVPDKHGNIADIVLGFESIEPYIQATAYFGAIIGRCGNRIANGRFSIDGEEYQLSINDAKNHLHGGFKGFDKVVWQASEVREADRVGVRLEYRSPDGEEGYPGNLDTVVYYYLTGANELIVEYEAVTDRSTIVNLTHHSYFNLGGEGSGNILDHQLIINADRITAVGDDLIPTGETPSILNTDLDFTSVHAIGERINNVSGGYDHNYVLNRTGDGMSFAARAVDPSSGRFLELYTTEPGVQFYTGNFLDGTLAGKAGILYEKHSGFCLETQHFPDSPNQPSFPSTILRPGEIYRHCSIHRFGW
jgi:aldose 1-epimerase